MKRVRSWEDDYEFAAVAGGGASSSGRIVARRKGKSTGASASSDRSAQIQGTEGRAQEEDLDADMVRGWRQENECLAAEVRRLRDEIGYLNDDLKVLRSKLEAAGAEALAKYKASTAFTEDAARKNTAMFHEMLNAILTSLKKGIPGFDPMRFAPFREYLSGD